MILIKDVASALRQFTAVICRSILVHARLSGSPEPVEVAVRLAKNLDAHLVGLCALRDVAVLKAFYRSEGGLLSEAFSQPLADQFVDYSYRRASAAEARFIEAAERVGVSREWLVGEGGISDLLHVLGGLQDLVVVGQTDPNVCELGWDVAEQTVLMPDQTTLVIPYAGRFPVLGQRILVAWNGSHQAACAVRGAQPLLRQADKVTLLIGRMREAPPGVTRMPPVNVQDHLLRLNAKTDVVTFDVPDCDAGEQILAHAQLVQADLVVMGAFGHSWLREHVLGGATRHVLGQTKIPVLMAH